MIKLMLPTMHKPTRQIYFKDIISNNKSLRPGHMGKVLNGAIDQWRYIKFIMYQYVINNVYLQKNIKQRNKQTVVVHKALQRNNY